MSPSKETTPDTDQRFVTWWLGVERRVIALGYRFLGSGDAAQDLAQDIALSALDQFDKLTTQSHFDGWVLRRTKWQALDMLRLDRSPRSLGEHEANLREAESLHAATPPDEGVISTEEIMAAVSQLPERQQLAILGAIEGAPTREIAAKMKVSEATVRSLIRFARFRLLDLLPDVARR